MEQEKMMSTGNQTKIKAVLTLAAVAMAFLATSAQAETTTITGTANGPGSTGHNSDSWNNPDNWDPGIPSGTIDTIVAVNAGVFNNDTPAYTGTLTLEENVTLKIGGPYSQNVLNSLRALGTDGITMNAGSEIHIQMKSSFTYPSITMAGDAQITSASTESHSRNYTIGSVTGVGTLTISGTHRNLYRFNDDNPSWLGGLVIEQNSNNNVRVEADATGCLGTGNVTSETGTTLQMDAADAMADDATLSLNGSKAGEANSKLIMNADDTIAELIIDDATQPYGDYTAASGDWISGTGILSVVGADPNEPDVDAGVDMITLSGMDVVLAPTVVNNDTQDPNRPLSHTWTTDAPGGYTVEWNPSNTVEAPTVTITPDTPGNPQTVTLTLEVNLVGTSSTASDTMEIDVYNDACLAAQVVSSPSEPFDPSDFDKNCITDLRDYAVLAAKWLVDYALTAPVAKP